MAKRVAIENICSLMFLCMFLLCFFYKSKNMFLCFLFAINVFNIYAVKARTERTK